MIEKIWERHPSEILKQLLKDHTVLFPKTVVLGKRTIQFLCMLMSGKENYGNVLVTRYVKPRFKQSN